MSAGNPSNWRSARGDARHHHSFGGVHAVERVSVDLFPGEVVGLLGHNGAGKSTLIKILSGAYKRDSGEIRIDGEVGHQQPARRQGATASRRSTRPWRWPTMSTPPPISFSAASCVRHGARSTTSPWSARRARSWAASIPASAASRIRSVAVGRPAPIGGDRPRHPFQRPLLSWTSRRRRWARRRRPGRRTDQAAQGRRHRHLPDQPRHSRRLRPRRPGLRDEERPVVGTARPGTSPRTRCWA